MSLTPRNIREDASRVIDYIESELSRTVWKTRARIQESIMKKHPEESNNIFLFEAHWFLYFLLSFVNNGAIQSAEGKTVFGSGERFEEGEREPVLFEDIELTDNDNSFTAVNERVFNTGLSQGKNWETIREENTRLARYLIPDMIAELRKDGLCSSQIFYKLPHGTSSKNEQTLPALPMELV